MAVQNSASRIHEIVLKASRVHGKTAVELWADVFQIPENELHCLMMEISQRLIWLDSELNVLIDFLSIERNYADEDYAVIQSGVRNAISPQVLAQQSDHIRGHLKPEVVASLKQIALNLPDEEARISEDQLANFQEILDKLSAKLTDVGIGTFLASVLRRHIRLLQRALDAYPIWGVRAFSDALRDALGDLFMFEKRQKDDDVNSEEEKSVVENLKSAWKQVSAVVNEADKLRKLAVLGGELYAAISWVDNHLG